MLGKLNSDIKDVHVIGGGVSGLLATYQCLKLGYNVTLFEKNENFGGMIRTHQLKNGIAEQAAHSLLSTPQIIEFLKEIDCPFVEINEHSKARFIYHKNQFSKFPLSVLSLIRLILGILFIPVPKLTNSTKVSDWVDIVLGRAATKALFTAFTRGVYGVGPEQLSVRAAFPALATHERIPFFWAMLFKLLTKGKPKTKMIAPENGMSGITQALLKKIMSYQNLKIKNNSEVRHLPENVNVILSLPPHEASELLKPSALSDALKQIQYSSLVSVNLICEKKHFKKIPQGVGVLMTKENDTQCLGVLFNSSTFKKRVLDEENFVSLTAMYPFIEEQQIHQIVLKDLSKLFGYSGTIAAENIKVNVWKKAIPVYDEKLLYALNLAENTWAAIPGNILFGNYSGKVSLRGMIEDVLALE